MIDVHCKYSPTGRHYWSGFSFHGHCCAECGQHFTLEEIANMLNAAMQLTAEEAMPTFDDVMGRLEGLPDVDEATISDVVAVIRKRNRPYADTWEGKDE